MWRVFMGVVSCEGGQPSGDLALGDVAHVIGTCREIYVPKCLGQWVRDVCTCVMDGM